jgi:hypothetical protein
MEEQLVSYGIARLAARKEFDEECYDNYIYHKAQSEDTPLKLDHWILKIKNSDFSPERYTAPTQSFLQKWIREKHDIHIEIYANASGYGYTLTKGAFNGSTIKEIDDDKFYETFEQALERGLFDSLMLIKK